MRDAQYHMALYELMAEINFKHVAILKKRQIASSYFHMAKLINQWVFESGAVLKIGASLKDYINEKDSISMHPPRQKASRSSIYIKMKLKSLAVPHIPFQCQHDIPRWRQR